MELPKPYPCEKCGGATNWCFFGKTPSGAQGLVFMVTKQPLEMNTTKRQYFINLLSEHLDPNSVFFTSLIKCNDKSNSKKATTQCKNWLAWEIKKEKPALVITGDAAAYEAITGRSDSVDGVGQVRLLKLDGHAFWHLHLDDPSEIAKMPERDYFQKWAAAKITPILKGEYPKNPAAGKDYRYCTTLKEVQDWCDDFHDKGTVCALDTEGGGKDEEGRGVGVDPFRPESFLISLQATIVPGTAIFYDDTKGSIAARNYLLDFVSTKWQVLHNATFDYKFIREKWDRNMWDRFYFDTMVADHTLREWDRKRSLKRLADLFLPEFEDYEQSLYNWFDEKKIPRLQKDYADVPREMLFQYGCMDTDVTIRLFTMQTQWLEEAGLLDLYFEHVNKTIRVYGDDMHPGWGLSLPRYNELKAEFIKNRMEAIKAIQALPFWEQWKGHKEVDLKAKGLRFWDEQSGCCYTDSSMHETLPEFDPDNPKRRYYYDIEGKPPRRCKKWTYEPEDLEPDPTNRSFKCDLLYGDKYLGLPIMHTTDNGDPAAHEIALIYLKKQFANKPHVETLITNFQQLDKNNKFLSTFIVPAYDHYDSQGKFKFGWLRRDGYAHPDYMLSGGEGYAGDTVEGGTNSGRPSCKNPNQLNIPSRDKNGKKIKQMYIPVPRDVNLQPIITTEQWFILQLDYSQLELRVLADRSNDPFMVNAYKQNLDLHTNLACERFDRSVEWFKERLKDPSHPEFQQAYEWRQCAKTSWFAFIYGAGIMKLVETLAKQGVWIHPKDMKDIIDGLKQTLPMVEALKMQVLMNAPVCVTPFGRRRVVQNIKSTDNWIKAKAGRQLFNFLIQSTGADICSRGMYLACEWLREQRKLHGLRSYPMGNVYDSFILAVPASELDYVAYNVQQIMESPNLPWTPLVPLKVDVESGPTWGNLEPWEWKAAA